MAPEGRLLVIGFATGTIPSVEANRLLLRHHEVIGVNWGGMLPLDQEFPVRAARDLHRWLEQAATCGRSSASATASRTAPARSRTSPPAASPASRSCSFASAGP